MAERLRYVNTASSAGGDGTGGIDDTAGADRAYASLSEWESAQQADLVTAGDTSRALCRGTTTADTTAVTIDGWTTGASNYITIESADAHGGSWNTSAYRLVTSDFFQCLIIREDYVRVVGCQFENSRATADGGRGGAVLADVGHGDVRFIRCIARKTNGAVSNNECCGFGATSSDNDKIVRIVNCLAYDFQNNYYVSNSIGTTGHLIVLYNNTSVDAAQRGFMVLKYGTSDTWREQNNLMQGSNTNYYSESTADTQTSARNVTEDATSPDGATYQSKVATFVNEGSDDFHIASGDTVCNVGVDLSADGDYAFSDDLSGDTRTGTWDVGSDQRAAAGGTTRGTPFGHRGTAFNGGRTFHGIIQ